MKREKQRQLRNRRRRKILFRRALMIAGCVVVILLFVTGVRALAGVISSAGRGGGVSQTQADASEVTEESTEEPEENTDETVEAVETEESSGETGDTDADSEEESESEDNTVAYDENAEAEIVAVTDDRTVSSITPGWQIGDDGWWYALDDSTCYADGWMNIDNNTYYFTSDGYMQTGWAAIDGVGCYFSETGVYDPDKEKNMIALTFDDGPGEYTSELLDLLEQYGAKATFFMVGEKVEVYGEETISRMVELGCELGNHTYDHQNLTEMTEEEILNEFETTDSLIESYSGGVSATLARTPYGLQDKSITSLTGRPCIYWSLDTLDWETKDATATIEAVVGNVSEGDIILMHDIWPTTVEACATIIPSLIEEGFELVTVSEMAAANGISMEDGVTYYDFYPGVDATAGAADTASDASDEDNTEESQAGEAEETYDEGESESYNEAD